jgi:hypothetical protein
MKNNFWLLNISLGWVYITWILKEYKEKLKLVSQSTLLFSSPQVWLICTCQFCIRRTKVGGLPLILTFPVIMSTKFLSHFLLADDGNFVSKQTLLPSTYPTSKRKGRHRFQIFAHILLSIYHLSSERVHHNQLDPKNYWRLHHN